VAEPLRYDLDELPEDARKLFEDVVGAADPALLAEVRSGCNASRAVNNRIEDILAGGLTFDENWEPTGDTALRGRTLNEFFGRFGTVPED
jgi:hypothetical protein